jgi:hypothetical protein
MPRETRRRLTVLLSDDAYRKLQAWAQLEDRMADQQASYLLRRLLEDHRDGAADGPGPLGPTDLDHS